MDSIYSVVLVLAGILLVLLLCKLRNFTKLYSELPSYPLFRNVIISAVLRKIPWHIPVQDYFFQLMVQASKQFQKEGMFLMWVPEPYLVVFGEESVKTFSNDAASLDKPRVYEILREAVGTGLLTSNSEAWKKQRKMLNPAFHVGMLKKHLKTFNDNAEILVRNLEKSINDPYINVFEFIKPCTFGGIFEYTLGLKMDSEDYIVEKFTNVVSDISKIVAHRFANVLHHFKFMRNIIPSDKKFENIMDESRNILRMIILKAKENIVSETNKIIRDDPENNQEMSKSLPRILFNQHLKDPSFTFEDLEGHVIALLVGGYDTVTFTIMWCLFMLGLHPEVQDQAYSEIDSISKGQLENDDLPDLKYLDCVIKETLRLYPTAPVYSRRTSKDIQCGKYKVPSGTSIVFFSYTLHRNPKIFPDPEKFNPDRFMNETIENLSGNFIPFGAGIRHCIGKRFAMMEMKVILAHILRHFQIRSLDRREEVGLCWEIVLAPARPLRFKLTPRK